jgi:hypothetical protein
MSYIINYYDWVWYNIMNPGFYFTTPQDAIFMTFVVVLMSLFFGGLAASYSERPMTNTLTFAVSLEIFLWFFIPSISVVAILLVAMAIKQFRKEWGAL